MSRTRGTRARPQRELAGQTARESNKYEGREIIMFRYISHLSFSTRATLHLTLSPPPAELRGDFLFVSFVRVRVRVLISSFLPIQLGNSFF